MLKPALTGAASLAAVLLSATPAQAKLVETLYAQHGAWKVFAVKDDAAGNQLNRCLMDIRNARGEMLRIHLGFSGDWAISIPSGGNAGNLTGDVIINGPLAQTVPSTWNTDGARASRAAIESWIQRLRKANTLSAHYDGTGANARTSYEYIWNLGPAQDLNAAIKSVRLCWANNHL
ncbi:hypothetical protein ACFQ1E_11330 [Sphingomonas canadensis]|uniref:Uncharacterized protein n=1 Tax=Sphingomonas canadensis TaxID=1219257 RepID=A0ABW3H6Z6_9SPHN|nr:hypothetical protein [Sphingomonas canadensis]MCW3836287.1 hypothetical protein [Sphingomonas canadensis]